mmetsp:Transcript_13384/g.42177  ORF Transcript_13384/g.42177 Transcript_13384/m.42177 type:complete len:96 (-) Transcript_13384:1296-1583(-)
MAPEKKSVFDVSSLVNTKIVVSFSGGRRVEGVLLAVDNLSNLVLGETVELCGAGGTESTRKLGQVVARGTAIISVSPPGSTIHNPLEGDLVASTI